MPKKFIFKQSFLANLALAGFLALAIVFCILFLLNEITNHGEHLTVPSVVGKQSSVVVNQLKEKGFDVVIQDSIYTDTLPKGVVIKQLPDANSTVKVNRTIYLTINRMVPPQIAMPDLLNKNLLFALNVLKKAHLELQDTIFKPDFQKGTVLEQQYNGKIIATGALLQWGSKITLVIASGVQDTNLPVPDLIGMKYSEAKPLIDSMGVLLMPVVDNDVKDTMNAYIVKQDPPHLDAANKFIYIKPGMFMNVTLSVVMHDMTDSIQIKNK